ncbi:MAG: YaaR family protein [Clostridium sp.]|uniref:YaaR family protein n=1 Tax=Clostridium sp. TaxID=1506 RepID=UPI003F3FAC1C
MEIGRVRGSSLRTETKNISNRKDFSQSFSDAKERKSEEELKKMMGNIKKKGDRLTISKTYGDVMGYKKLIKEYLESVLQYMYENKKDISFWQTQYFITVETIDGKLEELTKAFIDEEMEHINIASTVDEIQGLLVDIYR